MRRKTLRPELLLVLLAAAGCGGSDAADNGPIVANRADGIYVVDPRSGRASEIPGLDDFSSPAVSPDGRMLALNGGLDLYVSRLDGTGLRRVIGNGYDASWSPDGEHLVFTRDACAYRGEDCNVILDHTAELAVVDVDGSNLRRLTFDMVYQGRPDWSPDGERIAFEGDAGVYVMDTETARASGRRPAVVARRQTPRRRGIAVTSRRVSPGP